MAFINKVVKLNGVNIKYDFSECVDGNVILHLFDSAHSIAR